MNYLFLRTVSNLIVITDFDWFTVDFQLVLLLGAAGVVGGRAGVFSVVQRWHRGQDEQGAVLQDGHAGFVPRQLLTVPKPLNYRLRQTCMIRECVIRQHWKHPALRSAEARRTLGYLWPGRERRCADSPPSLAVDCWKGVQRPPPRGELQEQTTGMCTRALARLFAHLASICACDTQCVTRKCFWNAYKRSWFP